MKSQKEIIEIMNQARCYETDKNKTLPFTYRECERAVEIALKSKEKEIIKIMDEIKHKEKNFVNMWYSLERELRIKQNNREKLKGDKK